MEEAREVDMSGAERAAMTLADMDVAKPVAHLVNRPYEVVLLDVHVIGVEMDDHIALADIVGQIQGLPGGVHDIRFVAIADLQSQGDAMTRGLLGEVA